MNYSTVGKNLALYSIGTIAIRTSSFLLIPVYTYSLSVSDYGLLAVLLHTSQILVIVAGIGSRTALVRFAREYEQKGEIGCLIGTTVFINILGTTIVTALCATILMPLFRSVFHVNGAAGYVLLTCATAASNSLAYLLMAYYRAGHRGAQVTIANVAAAASLIAASALFVRGLKWGIVGGLVAQALIYGLLALYFLINISSQVRLRISFPLTINLIRFGLPLIFVMTGGLITQTSALYFLSYFHGLADAGIYSLGLKLAVVAEMVLILPFEMAYEPFVYGQIGSPGLWNTISRLLTYLMVAFTFLASVILFTTRDLLPIIAPAAFGRAYLITFLILPSVAFRGVYYIGESLLFLEKRTGTAGTVVTCFSMLSIGLNWLLISRLGMYGAASVFIFTTVCTGAIAMKMGLKVAPVRLETARLAVTAVLLFALLGSVYKLSSTTRLVYYVATPAVLCLGTVALLSSGFMHDDEKRALRQLFGRKLQFTPVRDV
jgi:O-antigen/teichoic acid export membrane protein